MKNILVSIFVYITLARSSDRCTEGHGSYSEFEGNSDINPPITPIVPSPEHPCPSNEPVEATLQNMLDSIKGCLKKIKEYEIEADELFSSYTTMNDVNQVLLGCIKNGGHKTSSDRKEKNQKIDIIAVCVINFDIGQKVLEIVWASYKQCKELIEKKRKAIRNIIKEMEVKFPFKSQDGLKQFEEIPQYLDARDRKSIIMQNIRIE